MHRINKAIKRHGIRGVARLAVFAAWHRMERAFDRFVDETRVAEGAAQATRRLDGKLLDHAPEYRRYIGAQIKKSYRVSRSVRWWSSPAYSRSAAVDLLHEHLPPERRSMSALCVGCRDQRELNYVEWRCQVADVRGLDLFSSDPRIEIGDMHRMPFESDAFDIVIANHSLEHSYDLQVAMAEIVRVVRNGGYVEVELPLRFSTTEVDRHDLRSIRNILGYLPPHAAAEVLALEDCDDARRHGRIVMKVTKHG